MTLKKTTKEIYEILEKARETDKVYDSCRTIIDAANDLVDIDLIKACIDRKPGDNSLTNTNILYTKQDVLKGMIDYYEKEIQNLNKKRIKTDKVKEKIEQFTDGYEKSKQEFDKLSNIIPVFNRLNFSIEETILYAVNVEMNTVKDYVNTNVDDLQIKKIFRKMLNGDFNKYASFDKLSFIGSWLGDNNLKIVDGRVNAMLYSYTAYITRETMAESGLKQIKDYINHKTIAEDINYDDELEK